MKVSESWAWLSHTTLPGGRARDFPPGKLIETPAETLDLEKFPEENQADARAYIQHYLAIPKVGANIKSWLAKNFISEVEFCQ